MKPVLSKLDKILVGIGRYPGRKELIEDALRALIRAKPELRMDVAIELYRKREVSLLKMTDNPLKSLASYSRFVGELFHRPTVKRSTLAIWSE